MGGTEWNVVSQWRTQKVSEGAQSFVTVVWRQKPALLLLKLLGFALHFFIFSVWGGTTDLLPRYASACAVCLLLYFLRYHELLLYKYFWKLLQAKIKTAFTNCFLRGKTKEWNALYKKGKEITCGKESANICFYPFLGRRKGTLTFNIAISSLKLK